MNIKHQEIIIDKNVPFANCKLGREKYAEVLTSIVETYADGFVFAINNEWGTGKTTFVKMWQQQLNLSGFKTLYFNAWENDFDNNPLVAIMAELGTLVVHKSKNEATFKSALKKGSVVVKNILPALVKGLAKKYVDIEEIQVAIEELAKAGTEIFEEEINEYTNKKKNLIEFRKEIEKFIEETESVKPIVFIIDELDRCRPNYSVEILEQIKHFFSVNGIVFVLSIDKLQLGHAIRGVYGSENINTEDYLRRFIDLEYSIQDPDTKQSCSYFFEYFSFDEFFKKSERNNYREFQNERTQFLNMAIFLFQFNKVKLRQQEKIFAHARIALKTVKIDNYLFPEAFLYLSFVKAIVPTFYSRIKDRTLSMEDFSEDFYKTVPSFIDRHDDNNIVRLQASLVSMYHQYLFPDGNSKYEVDDDYRRTLNLKSKFDQSDDGSVFKDSIRRVREASNRNSIVYVLNKLDLIENITT